MNTKFAIYTRPETFNSIRPLEEIQFVGHSVPHFQSVLEGVMEQMPSYTQLPLRHVDFREYTSVHSKEYIGKITNMSQGIQVDERPKWSIECSGLEYLLPGLEYTLGGHYEAIDQISAGRLKRAYIMGMAGGHHAYRDHGHGYCIVHMLAAGVRYAQKRGFKNILIVDYDIHHGDGTQSIFANDPTVHCISSHSIADLYMLMATRSWADATTTAAQAVGHQNIPLLWQRFSDDFWNDQTHLTGTYYRARNSISAWQNALNNLPFSPDLIYVFSGYDGHKDDGGNGITNWTNNDFVILTEMILRTAHEHNCPVISTHGGGYKLPVTISATLTHLDVLAKY